MASTPRVASIALLAALGIVVDAPIVVEILPSCHSIADHVYNPGKKYLDAPTGRTTQFREVAPAGMTFKIVFCAPPLLPKH